MFVITGPDEVPVTASFKASEEDFEELTARKGITPSAYLGRYHWVHVDDLERLGKKQREKDLKSAYVLVAHKLPKATKKKLGIETL